MLESFPKQNNKIESFAIGSKYGTHCRANPEDLDIYFILVHITWCMQEEEEKNRGTAKIFLPSHAMHDFPQGKEKKIAREFPYTLTKFGKTRDPICKILFFNFHFKKVRNDIQTSWKTIPPSNIILKLLPQSLFPDSQTWYFILLLLDRVVGGKPTAPYDWFWLTWQNAGSPPPVSRIPLARHWKNILENRRIEKRKILSFLLLLLLMILLRQSLTTTKEDPKEEDVDRQQ